MKIKIQHLEQQALRLQQTGQHTEAEKIRQKTQQLATCNGCGTRMTEV